MLEALQLAAPCRDARDAAADGRGQVASLEEALQGTEYPGDGTALGDIGRQQAIEGRQPVQRGGLEGRSPLLDARERSGRQTELAFHLVEVEAQVCPRLVQSFTGAAHLAARVGG